MQSLRYFTKDEIDNLICYGKRNSEFEEILNSISDNFFIAPIVDKPEELVEFENDLIYRIYRPERSDYVLSVYKKKNKIYFQLLSGIIFIKNKEKQLISYTYDTDSYLSMIKLEVFDKLSEKDLSNILEHNITVNKPTVMQNTQSNISNYLYNNSKFKYKYE